MSYPRLQDVIASPRFFNIPFSIWSISSFSVFHDLSQQDSVDQNNCRMKYLSLRNLYDVSYYLYNIFIYLFKILHIFHYSHSSLSLCVYSIVKMVRIKFWNFFFTWTNFHCQRSYEHGQNGILKLKYYIFQKENFLFRGVNKVLTKFHFS